MGRKEADSFWKGFNLTDLAIHKYVYVNQLYTNVKSEQVKININIMETSVSGYVVN